MADDDLPRRLTLQWLPRRYAVCRLDPAAPLPVWVRSSLKSQVSSLLSITRNATELSIVIDESQLPSIADPDAHAPIQRGFAALRIAGTLDFDLVGILARLTSALSAASVSVFVLSTYETDILLVRERDAMLAFEALRTVCEVPPPPAK